MHDFLTEKFEYDLECNLQMIQALEKTSDKTAHELFSHIMNAQHIWYQRIKGNSPNFSAWDDHRQDKYVEMATTNCKKILRIIKNMPLDEVISYHDSKGIMFENTINDILFHLLTHSIYHRGQLAKALRAQGIKAPNTDYISYIREK